METKKMKDQMYYHTDEAKARIGKANSKPKTAEHKAKIKAALKGRVKSREWVEKIHATRSRNFALKKAGETFQEADDTEIPTTIKIRRSPKVSPEQARNVLYNLFPNKDGDYFFIYKILATDGEYYLDIHNDFNLLVAVNKTIFDYGLGGNMPLYNSMGKLFALPVIISDKHTSYIDACNYLKECVLTYQANEIVDKSNNILIKVKKK